MGYFCRCMDEEQTVNEINRTMKDKGSAHNVYNII